MIMNKLIKNVLCMLFLLATGYYSFGQVRIRMPIRRYVPVQRYNQPNMPNPGKRMQLVKEGFISRQLRLTPDESRAFWPVYRQYVQDQTAIKILERQNTSNNSPNGTQQIDNELKYEMELVNIRKHYRDEFLKILPPQKVSELYKSERQFNDEVLRQLSERSVRAGD
jgi:hypothetical protein